MVVVVGWVVVVTPVVVVVEGGAVVVVVVDEVVVVVSLVLVSGWATAHELKAALDATPTTGASNKPTVRIAAARRADWDRGDSLTGGSLENGGFQRGEERGWQG